MNQKIRIFYSAAKPLAGGVIACLSCLLFLLCGLAVLPYPGIQYDEALFTAPLFNPKWDTGGVFLFHFRLPFMLMSYLGCLKSWLYKPIFLLWSPSVYSLRLPVLLSGMVTIYLFWVLLSRTVGDRAAVVGVVLLATDSTFLLTTCFDWGPVVLQHLLMLGGVLAMVEFYKARSEKLLGFGFFLFGLGLWDKALFSWTLLGLAAATSLAFPGKLWKHLNYRRVLIAGLSFLLGAFPLLWYNIVEGGSTFATNAKFSLRGFTGKVHILEVTADGSGLFGYLVRDDPPRNLPLPHTLVERASVSLTRIQGEHRRNFMIPAFLLAALALPIFWRAPVRRPMLFSLILLVVVWLQMALTSGAGGAPHHVILVWPWPIFFIAVAFAHTSMKLGRYGGILLATVVLILVVANLMVTNQYLEQLIENGPGTVWTDAIFPLADYLQTQPAREIYSVDWGTMNPLRLLDRGALPLEEATFLLLKKEPDQEDRQFLTTMITNNDNLMLAHTKQFEAFRGINARLADFASSLGYRRESIVTIYDREGNAVFDVFRFRQRQPDK